MVVPQDGNLLYSAATLALGPIRLQEFLGVQNSPRTRQYSIGSYLSFVFEARIASSFSTSAGSWSLPAAFLFTMR